MRLAEADGFILRCQTTGITTPALKREATKIVKSLTDQFDRMDAKWKGLGIAFSQLTDVAVETALNDLEKRYQDMRTRVEAAEETIMALLDNANVQVNLAPNQVGGAPQAFPHPPPVVQQPKPPPKLDISWRPPILSSEATLTVLNNWSRTFEAHVDANKDYITSSSNKMKKIFMTSLWDSKLNAALEADVTMKNIYSITEAGDGQSLSKWLKTYLLRFQPLYLLRYKYSLIKQNHGESFADFWDRKVIASQEAQLEDITAEAVQITEVITSVADEKLRNEFLKLQNPSLVELLALGHQSDHQRAIHHQNFSKGAFSNKVQSSYKKEKDKNWMGNKGIDRSQIPDRCKLCCSNKDCKNGVCANKNVECRRCGRKGHFQWSHTCPKYAPKVKKAAEVAEDSEDEEEEEVTARSNTVRARLITSRSAENFDDCQQTPMCSMLLKTRDSRGRRGHQFNHVVLPDTGCSQSIVAFDIVREHGMEINPKKKKRILNASDEVMYCNGTVIFNVNYCGLWTTVEALVSSDLEDEVLLGWQTLKRLRIIPEFFPRPIPVIVGQNSSDLDRKSENSKDGDLQLVRQVRHQRVQDMDQFQPCRPKTVEFQESEVLNLGKKDHAGPKCMKTFSSDNLYLSDDPNANVEQAMAAFPEVFKEPCEDEVLKIMKGNPVSIQLKPVPITPTHVVVARKTPFAFQALAKAELQSLVKMGIIEACGSEASEWCSPCHFVRKPNGGVRTVVDLQGLNKFVMRPTHPFPTGMDILTSIPKDSKVFAVFDCLKGYWQLELDKESRKYTTFMTEFGRFRYLRAPMGLSASGDEFCLRTDEAIANLPGVKKLVDDVLVVAPNHEVMLERIIALFKCCQASGISLSKSKFQYGEEVKFSGFIVNSNGYKPDPSKLAAIANFPVPKNLTDMRSFYGLTNQIAAFSPDLKHALAPLQPLLKPKYRFAWQPEHQTAFEQVKQVFTAENGPLLRHFDPELPATLTTDASRTGIGFVLTQMDKMGNTGLIQCGSRFLSPAEGNYAVVELEAVGVQWAILKCRHYLLGTSFKVLTDHKPLVGVMNGRDVDSLSNARLQRICSKLIGYQFEVAYLPGKLNFISDALSRSPVFQPEAEEQKDVLVQTLKVKALDPKLEVIIEAASEDGKYQDVINALKTFVNSSDLPFNHPGRLYRQVWSLLAYEKDVGLLTLNGRIVVPRKCQKSILDDLHVAHSGEVKTYANARQLYYWPNMKRDISNLVSTCQECVTHLPSKPKTPLQQTTASRPFEAMSADLAQYEGQNYLVVVDRYSGWISAARLNNLTTSAVTNIMTDWYCDFGWPLFLRTDGGGQFRSEFIAWCVEHGIKHELSSPENHKSNGHAEKAVQTVKKLLAKVDGNWKKFRAALLEWRNTPNADGLSPAQWALGHRQRSSLTVLPKALDRVSDQFVSRALDRREVANTKVKNRFDQNKKPDVSIPNGTRVMVQAKPNGQGKPGLWDSCGTVVSRRPHTDEGQSYIVDIDGRQAIRGHLRLRPIAGENSEVVDMSITENPAPAAMVVEPPPSSPMTYAEAVASKETKPPKRGHQPHGAEVQPPLFPPRKSDRKNIKKPVRYRD